MALKVKKVNSRKVYDTSTASQAVGVSYRSFKKYFTGMQSMSATKSPLYKGSEINKKIKDLVQNSKGRVILDDSSDKS